MLHPSEYGALLYIESKGDIIMTVLPVYNRILVPNTTIYLQRELYHMLAGKEPVQGERLLMLVEKKKQN